MAKHRLEQPRVAAKVAKTAVVTGSIAVGALALAAGPADAAPVNVPGVGTFEVPGINDNQVPPQFQQNGNNGGGLLNSQPVRAQKALRAAESKIGSPYVYGAAGPNAFDCSGLVYWSYKQAGKTIPRDSYGQLGGGQRVSSLADAKPGDVLIFNGGGHAGIYAGHGQFIHASTEGVPVKRAPVKAWALTGIRRY
ncbi:MULTISPECIES: C40 family peptidase [unclassified Gordonia (in: high G+C Gram-positive bacteria)]|uniref:C40 family peptidase n=1 Tax=unclassified Gordonia (in: high G+C Gram-positive bacteria) TaxID=2657482 RepID=UPI0020003AD8|nr:MULTISPECIES: C40 family peptidase [unclassified Gordonia (in: high G+C Gram-positive bacteria)]UQE73620.1 C40 family peptidase [Gordonia sp. PP30]